MAQPRSQESQRQGFWAKLGWSITKHYIQYLVHYEGYGKEHNKWHPSSKMARRVVEICSMQGIILDMSHPWIEYKIISTLLTAPDACSWRPWLQRPIDLYYMAILPLQVPYPMGIQTLSLLPHWATNKYSLVNQGWILSFEIHLLSILFSIVS